MIVQEGEADLDASWDDPAACVEELRFLNSFARNASRRSGFQERRS